MNRLILKYATPITVVILVIFGWVVYRRIVDGGPAAIVPLGIAAVVVWAAGTFLFVYFWPRITVGGFRRVFTKRGMGGGPIPVNTLYAVPESASQSATAGSVIATGADDLLYLGGWLEVAAGPQVLHVPDSAGRYLSIQFTDPVSGSNFAYVGTRTTGTGPGDFLLCDAGWGGTTPRGMTRIDVPHRAALVIGRVFVADDADRSAAYALAKQAQLTPYRPA
ncbi:DUF1254 domain-containing protein [Leifsonia sp. L25]|uniref:DUF1254 domain-containing protein n=1 Tax=Actinomycetes TaxID=1760 RepID=UPI003D699A9C